MAQQQKRIGLLSGDMCTEIVLGLYALFPHLKIMVCPLSRIITVNGYIVSGVSISEEIHGESKSVAGRCAAIIQGAIERNKPRTKKRKRGRR